MKKWNYKTKKYENFKSPAKNPVLYIPCEEGHLEIEIECTNCGKRVKYGDCYTSKIIHNYIGIGYPVCPKCYEEEHAEERSIEAFIQNEEEK